jgi:hypothetical protein
MWIGRLSAVGSPDRLPHKEHPDQSSEGIDEPDSRALAGRAWVGWISLKEPQTSGAATFVPYQRSHPCPT